MCFMFFDLIPFYYIKLTRVKNEREYLRLKIHNQGKKIAKDIQIKCNPQFKMPKNRPLSETLFKHKFELLPGEIIETDVWTVEDMREIYKDYEGYPVFDFEIRYKRFWLFTYKTKQKCNTNLERYLYEMKKDGITVD